MDQDFDETARKLAARLGLSAAHCVNNAAMYREIAEALTRVHNEAIEKCAGIAKSQKEDDVKKHDAIPDDGWKGKLEWSRQTCELIENNIRAFTIPELGPLFSN